MSHISPKFSYHLVFRTLLKESTIYICALTLTCNIMTDDKIWIDHLKYIT